MVHNAVALRLKVVKIAWIAVATEIMWSMKEVIVEHLIELFQSIYLVMIDVFT